MITMNTFANSTPDRFISDWACMHAMSGKWWTKKLKQISKQSSFPEAEIIIGTGRCHVVRFSRCRTAYG